MRVLVTVFEQLVPISGGGTPRISSIIDVLAKRGHEVSVAASFAVDTREVLQILRCSKAFPLNNVSRLDEHKMRKYLLHHPVNICKVIREALKLRPDLVIAHNSIAGSAALLARKLSHSITVIDMTDLIFEYLSSYDQTAWAPLLQRSGEKIENKVIRESDKIITISNAMKKTLVQRGAKQEHVDVVYDGVRTDIFRPRKKEARVLREKYADGFENVVMHHGVIDPQDQPEIIVDAAVDVIEAHPDTKFWLIGNGASIPYMKEKARREGLAKHFFFSGWIPFEEVPTFISACDVGLVTLPDISSARIRVTLKGFEYWACEKPIVASNLPALREVVEPWQTGLLYQAGNPKDLAEKTCILLENRQLSGKMARAGQKLVREKYSWDKLATQFVSICESMLEL